jgi:hypothetical protein
MALISESVAAKIMAPKSGENVNGGEIIGGGGKSAATSCRCTRYRCTVARCMLPASAHCAPLRAPVPYAAAPLPCCRNAPHFLLAACCGVIGGERHRAIKRGVRKIWHQWRE